jgi:hypothetical protein
LLAELVHVPRTIEPRIVTKLPANLMERSRFSGGAAMGGVFENWLFPFTRWEALNNPAKRVKIRGRDQIAIFPYLQGG